MDFGNYVFCCGIPDGPCFVKSHLPGALYREALKKESELLQAANSGALRTSTISLIVDGEEQLYLQMDVLEHIAEVSPNDAKSIIRQYQGCFSVTAPPAYMYSIEDMCTVALTELDVLSNHGFLKQISYLYAKEQLLLL